MMTIWRTTFSGLCIRDHVLKIISINQYKKMIQQATLPLDPGIIENGLIKNQSAVVAILKPLLHKHQVTLLIEDSLVSQETMILPAKLSRQQLNEIIKKKYHKAYDFIVTKNTCHIYKIAENLLSAHQALAKAAGFKIKVIEPEHYALARLLTNITRTSDFSAFLINHTLLVLHNNLIIYAHNCQETNITFETINQLYQAHKGQSLTHCYALEDKNGFTKLTLPKKLETLQTHLETYSAAMRARHA